MGRESRQRRRRAPHAVGRPGAQTHRSLQIAGQLQGAGRLKQAEEACRRVLRSQPDHAEALRLLGAALKAQNRLDEAVASYRRALDVLPDRSEAHLDLGNIFRQQGKIPEAISEYERALECDPDLADAHLNLANILKDLDRLGEAIAHYERVLDLSPGCCPAHLNLGTTLVQQGRFAEAARCYTKVIELQPDYAEAHSNLGAALAKQGRFAEAIPCYEKAIALKPDFPDAYNNLGNSLKEAGRLAEAIECARKAIALKPDWASAHLNLANFLLQDGKPEDAAGSFERAIALDPGDYGAYNNLGNALKDLGKLTAAIECYRKTIELKPDYAAVYSNLGNALKDLDRPMEAIESYDRAIALDPGNAGLRWNRALALLTAGDLRRGWEEFDWGWKAKQRLRERPFTQPLWKGESLTGKTILVWGEQGVGDEIHFANMLPDVIAASDRCVIEVDNRLVPLFARSFPEADVAGRSDPPHTRTAWPDIDVHSPMGNLARWFRPTIESFPRHSGFLKADPERIDFWKRRLAGIGKGLKVGICWRSKMLAADRRRYYSALHQWGPILTTPGVSFVRLQYDECGAEIADAEARFGVKIHQWADIDLMNGLDECAALTSALDLVISGGTAVDAMAGALGTKTWLLSIRMGLNWYLLGQDYVPWYPSVRLFRREWDEGWEVPIGAVARELKALVECPAP